MTLYLEGMRHTYQGKFIPGNPEKYKGNPTKIIFRSSWELRFMKWCDNNEKVVWWQSEERRIPYFDPVTNKWRAYYPDFLMLYERSDGIKQLELVEVKPAKQTKPPRKNPKRKTKAWVESVKTYLTNQAKWKAAAEWCEDNGSNFRLITENELKLNRGNWYG